MAQCVVKWITVHHRRDTASGPLMVRITLEPRMAHWTEDLVGYGLEVVERTPRGDVVLEGISSGRLCKRLRDQWGYGLEKAATS